ncbi:MAG: hypothetical protein AAGA23_10260 [Pseudomonadota bacterium]
MHPRNLLRPWCAWLLLAASSSTLAQGPAGLPERLGLPPGTYWVAQDGAPVPLEQATPAGGAVLVLRETDAGFEPAGWFELEAGESGGAATGSRLLIDRQGPTAQLRIGGADPAVAGDDLRVGPTTRLSVRLEDPSGVAGWHLRDNHPVSIRDGRWMEGRHEVQMTATDAVGNRTEAPPVSFVVDATGPTINWSIAAEPLAGGTQDPVYAPPVPLQVEASDPAGVARLEFDAGEGWQAAGPALAIDATEVALRATDELGNESIARASWRFDLAPPEIRVVPVGEGRVTEDEISLPVGGLVRFEITDDGVGVAEASYRYNRKAPRPIPARLRFRDRGWYQLEVRAVDHLGNVAVRYFDVRTSPRGYRPDRARRVLRRGSP